MLSKVDTKLTGSLNIFERRGGIKAKYTTKCKYHFKKKGRFGKILIMKVAMKNFKHLVQNGIFFFLCILFTSVIGCSATKYRENADKVASEFIRQAQIEALGRTEPFSIELPSNRLRRRLLSDQNLPFSGAASLGVDELPFIEHWPEKDYPVRNVAHEPSAKSWAGDVPLKLSLIDSLQIAAANNREYQTTKEDIFQAALILDNESNNFRNTFFGALQSLFEHDRSGDNIITGTENTASAAWERRLKSGATLASGIFIDLAKLLTQGRSSSWGILADATITIPLLAGSGEYVVTEPLIQAERNLAYSLFTFERFKRVLAVRVASGYYDVLNLLDQENNERNNYQRLIESARNATRLAEAGRLPQIQVDQAYQDVLNARVRWIAAQQNYADRLDSFKIDVGLPTDTNLELDPSEFEQLSVAAKAAIGVEFSTRLKRQQEILESDDYVEVPPISREGGGPLELDYFEAIDIALNNRMDLRIFQGQVYDAQRRVAVAANLLQAGLTLVGRAEAGERRGISSADQSNAELRLDDGRYSAGFNLDLPWERTEEQNAYRNSYIILERSVRNVQQLEDQIKFELRNELRNLIEARENYIIQTQGVDLARRRVKSTELFLNAGRAQVRDILEAQRALVLAQNALTSALVSYRVSELELQRDMGVLKVDHKGVWSEFKPGQTK
jgi:outer membrane protein TolC